MGTPQLMELGHDDVQEENSLKELEALQKIFPFAPFATSYGMGWKGLQAVFRKRNADRATNDANDNWPIQSANWGLSHFHLILGVSTQRHSGDGLRRRCLSFVEVFAQSIAGISPTSTLVLVISLVFASAGMALSTGQHWANAGRSGN
jgi:hypothetical protein